MNYPMMTMSIATSSPPTFHRRHLDAETKRNIIAALLKRQPESSDRTIGKMVDSDHKTVAKVRAKLEDVGTIPHVETRTDSKGRKQPSKKPERQPTELEALRERAGKLGYKLRKRGDSYGLIPTDGEGTQSWGPIESTPSMLDIMEGKIASQIYSPCGARMEGANNSKVWLAANPGATMEDFEKALPPAPTGCDLESPEPAEQTALQPTDDADASAGKRKAESETAEPPIKVESLYSISHCLEQIQLSLSAAIKDLKHNDPQAVDVLFDKIEGCVARTRAVVAERTLTWEWSATLELWEANPKGGGYVVDRSGMIDLKTGEHKRDGYYRLVWWPADNDFEIVHIGDDFSSGRCS